MQVDVA